MHTPMRTGGRRADGGCDAGPDAHPDAHPHAYPPMHTRCIPDAYPIHAPNVITFMPHTYRHTPI
eukprot:12357076-Heterocapsa_arctica.AAC.1